MKNKTKKNIQQTQKENYKKTNISEYIIESVLFQVQKEKKWYFIVFLLRTLLTTKKKLQNI